MSEAGAWLRQAKSDYEAAELVLSSGRASTNCQVIAKCQQAVEKSVKGLVRSLVDAQILQARIGYTHPVERFMTALLHLPRRQEVRDLQSKIFALFSQGVRADIRAIERFVPKAPPPGQTPSRNTEYPFLDLSGSWKAPADEGVFDEGEVRRFRALAYRLFRGCSALVSAVNLPPSPGPRTL